MYQFVADIDVDDIATNREPPCAFEDPEEEILKLQNMESIIWCSGSYLRRRSVRVPETDSFICINKFMWISFLQYENNQIQTLTGRNLVTCLQLTTS